MDPLSAIATSALLCNEMLGGRLEAAGRDWAAVLATAPDFAMLRWTSAMILLHLGQSNKALEVLEAAPPEATPSIAGRLCVLLELGLKGRCDEALACVSPELLDRARKVEWWCWNLGESYAAFDERGLALDWLDHSVDLGFINYPYLSKYSVILRKLDGDPRFQRLLEKAKIAFEQFEP